MSRFRSRSKIAFAFAIATTAIAACTFNDGNDPNVPDRAGALAAADAAVSVHCSFAIPKDCPSMSPSYKTEIAPLVDRTCNTCHAAGKQASDRDLTTYKNLTKLETTSLVQVEQCLMPPSDAGADASLAPEERTELLQWFLCGSPNN
ncbi:MAG: hypothetical protein ABI461_09000 [Polyangiaceae bacterium]